MAVRSHPEEFIVINDDGGWCWFHSPRALMTPKSLIVGSIAAGSTQPKRRGSVEVSSLRPRSRRASRKVLHSGFDADDHAAPALLLLPGGAVLAMWTGHGVDATIRARSLRGRRWSSTIAIAVPERATYSNLLVTPGPGADGFRIYDYHRGRARNPDAIFTDDGGRTWLQGLPFIRYPDRPYVHYATDSGGRIHFLATPGHPSTVDNNLHYGVLDGDLLLSGTQSWHLKAGPVNPESLQAVFRGDSERVAWGTDLVVNGSDEPVAIWSVHVKKSVSSEEVPGEDHRYHYGVMRDGKWMTYEMGYAGSRLYPGEDDYVGLAVIDPDFPSTVYASTNSHPVTGEPLISAQDHNRHWEIYRADSANGGRSWNWEAMTRDSDCDNLRPVVPRRVANRTALVWLRGTYRTYKDYDTEVVARWI